MYHEAAFADPLLSPFLLCEFMFCVFTKIAHADRSSTDFVNARIFQFLQVLHMSGRTELPRNFLHKGLFLKEDDELLKGITSGTIKCKKLSRDHAIAWLGKPNENLPEVPQKFCDEFLDLFENIREDILCVHSYVIGACDKNTPDTKKTQHEILARGTTVISERKDHRFLVSLFCHRGHWYWVVIDSLHNKVYWGDSLYDDIAIPDPLIIFMWYYGQARQNALQLITTPKYTFHRIPSPKQRDAVSCGPMACGCLIALFLRKQFDSYPITEFDFSHSLMIRQRIVLSIAKGTLMTEIDEIIESIPEKKESPKSEIPVFFIPTLNVEQPTAIFQSLADEKLMNSIVPVDASKMELNFFGSEPLFSVALPETTYTEVTILVNFKMDPYYIFKHAEERIVLAVAALTSIVKCDEKRPIIRATTDRILQFINVNQYNPTMHRLEFNQAMQAMRYYPNASKVPKDMRSIKKQRTNGEKFWVLTKFGFETYVKPNQACIWNDVKRQQGRKTITTKKKDLLMLEDNPSPSTLKIDSSVPWITLVYDVVCQEQRPFSLDEVISRMPPFKVENRLYAYTELPKELKKDIRVAVRQGITTGAKNRARRPQRFYSFNVKPKIGKKVQILYVGLIEHERLKGQHIESANSFFEWKQFAKHGSPDFRLFCSTFNQQKILYQAESSGGWLDSTPTKLLTKKLIHEGTLFQIPQQENQWIMYNAERAIEYYNIMRVTIDNVDYGYSVATIPEGGTIVLQENPV